MSNFSAISINSSTSPLRRNTAATDPANEAARSGPSRSNSSASTADLILPGIPKDYVRKDVPKLALLGLTSILGYGLSLLAVPSSGVLVASGAFLLMTRRSLNK